jgi:hypothetical protein
MMIIHQMKPPARDTAKSIAWRRRDRGCVAPWNDILIAALSVLAECRVYPVDGQFEMMRQSGAGIVLYPPGGGGAYNPR